MWKSKKQFPVIFLEGIRTVSIAALPVHIAEIGHGAGLSFFIKDIFTEGRGGGKSLQEKLIRADGMAEMRVDVVFPVQNITGQFVCDAEPVRSFAELNPAPFQPVYTKQPLKHGEGMIGRLCQGRRAFPEKMPERNTFPGLPGDLSVEGDKFRAFVLFKESMDFILRFQRKIGAGQQVIVSIGPGSAGALDGSGSLKTAFLSACGCLQKQKFTGDLAVAAPADAEPLCKEKPGLAQKLGKTRKIEAAGFLIDMQIDIVASVIQTEKKLL